MRNGKKKKQMHSIYQKRYNFSSSRKIVKVHSIVKMYLEFKNTNQVFFIIL